MEPSSLTAAEPENESLTGVANNPSRSGVPEITAVAPAGSGRRAGAGGRGKASTHARERGARERTRLDQRLVSASWTGFGWPLTTVTVTERPFPPAGVAIRR